MRYILCWVFPPLVPLLCGKPFSSIFNIFLCMFLWYPGVYHAQWILENHMNDGRANRIVKAVNQPAWVKKMMPYQGTPERPVSRRRTRQPPARQEQPKWDHPAVGENGTQFKRRR